MSELSYSRVETFEKCPAAFWHSYVNHTPPDGYERVESWTGSLVHRVLEEALKETAAKRVPDPVGVLDRFERLWDETAGDHVLVVKTGRRINEYRRNGRAWLKDYLDEAWPFLDATPLLIEEPVAFPVRLPSGAPATFGGIVDRVDRLSDGRLRLIDYKTGAWMPTFEAQRDAFQLALYWRGLVERWPDTPGGVLVWHYLQNRQTKRLDPDAELVGAAVSWLTTTAGEIETRLAAPDVAARFPPRPSPLCRWCEYGYACDANPNRAAAPRPRPEPESKA